MKTAVVILAAGFSSRMGRDKALLELGGKTALERVVSCYQAVDVSPIVVVSGQNHEQLQLLQIDVNLVVNPHPEAGMFSSVKCGVAALKFRSDAFFMHPVDIPLIKVSTLELMLGALSEQTEVCGIVPVFAGKRGHPLLLSAQSAGAILAYNGTDGLRGLLSRCPLFEVPVKDQGVLLGMNTMQQYEDLQQYLAAQQL